MSRSATNPASPSDPTVHHPERDAAGAAPSHFPDDAGSYEGNYGIDYSPDYPTGSPDQYGRSRPAPPTRKPPFSRTQRLTITYGILCFVILLVISQLWLLMATMNAYLGGDDSVIWPAAIASFVCFGLNVGLVWYLYAMERP